MAGKKSKAEEPVEQVAAEIAAVDGVADVTVAEGDDAPVVVAEVEQADDTPRWAKYRLANDLPLDDDECDKVLAERGAAQD